MLLIPLFLGEPKQSTQDIPATTNNGFQSKIQPLPDAQNSVNQAPQTNVEQPNVNTGLVLKEFDQMQPIEPPPFMKEAPAPAPAVEVATPKQTEPPAAKVVAVPPVPKAVKETEKVVVKKAVEQKAPVKKAPEKKLIASGWVVQAGIFSKAENAESIAKVLRSNGHKPNVSDAQTSFGKAKRVWIGPFKNKADAQALSKKIEQQTGNGGYVAAYPFK